jgi:hypothetical protein
MQGPNVIKNASVMHEREKKVADGIIHSAAMTTFQREAFDGIIKSGLPEKSPKVKELPTVRPSATYQDVGYVHYPGSRYPAHKRR